MDTACMTWQEMFGSGAAIGTAMIITLNVQSKKIQLILRDLIRVTILMNQLFRSA
jgi:hypothetical protein